MEGQEFILFGTTHLVGLALIFVVMVAFPQKTFPKPGKNLPKNSPKPAKNLVKNPGQKSGKK